MNNHINEQNCAPNKDDNDFYKPLFLNDSAYEYYSSNKNINDVGKLTVWKLDDLNYNDKCIENNSPKNVTLENKSSSNEKCGLIWKKLKEIVELNDEDLIKMDDKLKNVLPGNSFYNMPIDLEDDNCGKSLKDFQLEGEYIQFDNFNSYNPCEKIKTSVEKKDILIDEPEVQLINKVNSESQNLTNYENEKIRNEKFESDDTINKNKIKSDLASSDNIKIKKKEKQGFKTSKKPNKKRMNIKPNDKSNNEKRNNGYNIEYVYTYGQSYRGGIYCGHKNCVDRQIKIPKNKGWITDSFLRQVNNLIKI